MARGSGWACQAQGAGGEGLCSGGNTGQQSSPWAWHLSEHGRPSNQQPWAWAGRLVMPREPWGMAASLGTCRALAGGVRNTTHWKAPAAPSAVVTSKELGIPRPSCWPKGGERPEKPRGQSQAHCCLLYTTLRQKSWHPGPGQYQPARGSCLERAEVAVTPGA